MVTYKDNEIEIIKCDEKQGGDKLTALHHQINEVLYSIQNQYVLPTTTVRVYDELVTIGKALGEYTPKPYELKKYNELIAKLRIVVKKLRTLVQPQENDPKETSTKILNYVVYNYLQNKPTTIEKIIKQLEKNKTTYNDVKEYLTETKLQPIKRANVELLTMISDEFSI